MFYDFERHKRLYAQTDPNEKRQALPDKIAGCRPKPSPKRTGRLALWLLVAVAVLGLLLKFVFGKPTLTALL